MNAATRADAVLAPEKLRLVGISKAYHGVRAVEPLSLEIPPGELLALLGPSGCGKTTTLMTAGFEQPDTGTVTIGERDVTRLPPNKRNLGMVFQNYSLFPHMTVAENIGYGLEIKGVRAAKRTAEVAAALRMVRLEGMEQRYPRQLSGGQQQRVALARSLITRPAVLLLDEPLGALDKNLREGMQFELRQLQKSLSITSVLVTHDQEEALTIADRIAVMHAGTILQLGTPAEVYGRPRTRFVAEFLGTANIWPAQVVSVAAGLASVSMRVGDQTIGFCLEADRSLAPGQKVELAIRPEKLLLLPIDGEPDVQAEPRLRLCVSDHVFRGSFHSYRLVAPGLDVPVISYGQTKSAAGQSVFSAGTEVLAHFDPSSAVLLEDS